MIDPKNWDGPAPERPIDPGPPAICRRQEPRGEYMTITKTDFENMELEARLRAEANARFSKALFLLYGWVLGVCSVGVFYVFLAFVGVGGYGIGPHAYGEIEGPARPFAEAPDLVDDEGRPVAATTLPEI